MKPGIIGHCHYWQNTQGKLCLSLENIKKFMVFETIDHAVNWLFLNDYKDCARELNKRKGV